MKFVTVAVGVFASLVSAAPPPANWGPWTYSYSTSTRCYTAMGSTSVPWGQSTSWSTVYTPCVVTSKTTSTVTTAPPSTTTIVTITSTSVTTAPTTVSTSTVTSTATTTSSSIVTTTSTVTSTVSTSTASVSTVPAPANFTPVQSSLPGAAYGGAGGTSPVVKRGFGSINYSGSIRFGSGTSKNQYQQGVRCYQSQQASTCSTTKVTSTTTVQGTSTGTVTVTSTSTVTSSVVPSATVTTTTTTTSTSLTTLTSTATTTSTTTTTTGTAVSTVYAACATNNFADSVNGNGIIVSVEETGSVNTVDVTVVNSAYDCCVAAITDPNIAQIWQFVNGGTQCSIPAGDQCAAQSDNTWSAGTGNPGTVTVGNAECGEFVS